MATTELWRMHLRSAAKNGNKKQDIVDYCIKNNIVGLGWPLEGNTCPKDAKDYIESARNRYKSQGRRMPGSIRFVLKFSRLDADVVNLIWARGTEGIYYLGRIVGPWKYSNKKKHLELDIPNQARCVWVEVGTEQHVPGKIIACFRARSTFQKIKATQDIQSYCMWLWNDRLKKQKKDLYAKHRIPGVVKPVADNADTFFEMIGADDCEDVVGIYLQKTKKLVFLPGSQQRDTQGTEYYLKSMDGKLIAVQVKQGNIHLKENRNYSAKNQ